MYLLIIRNNISPPFTFKQGSKISRVHLRIQLVVIKFITTQMALEGILISIDHLEDFINLMHRFSTQRTDLSILKKRWDQGLYQIQLWKRNLFIMLQMAVVVINISSKHFHILNSFFLIFRINSGGLSCNFGSFRTMDYKQRFVASLRKPDRPYSAIPD